MVVLSFVAGVVVGCAVAAVYWATKYWEARRLCDKRGKQLVGMGADYVNKLTECNALKARLADADARRRAMQYDPFSNN